MVTKPGGMFTTECITKSTPMVFISPVPGQEGLNARYYARNGAAVVTRSTGHIVSTVSEILNDENRLDDMTRSAEKLILPGSAAIADHILASF
jgi:processive 1,2-diacylglycerol beta-glucosyltransferase